MHSPTMLDLEPAYAVSGLGIAEHMCKRGLQRCRSLFTDSAAPEVEMLCAMSLLDIA